ncbi:hypothetical protein PV10_05368 [Exophiala mesophila]|uniref:WSC domain-containing protein n=1 Tax=Exophiala mesophila TaxID=212818 RepID=A0A0D1Z7F2_EXOME|nr:uncharacterized protein PV10_05368 [Exophiala mesophila]KIV90742.1 hypothetical protein PV10_05368 [Exophiala mesophila]
MFNRLSLCGSSHHVLSAILVVLLLLFSETQGLDISYCSPENNAGSFPTYNYPYQSNGACQQHCVGSYAFAVLQGNDCWCSNYIPADQVSTSDCNQPCPGYPSEWCGSTDEGLYGYFLLSPGIPSGTLGATPSQTTSVSISSNDSGSSSLATTITITTVQTISPSTSPTVITVGRPQSSEETSSTSTTRATSSTSSRSTSRSTSTSGSTTGSATSSDQQTEVYTSVTTVTGEIRTVIVTPSPTVSSDANLGQPSAGGGGGTNVGKVVGIVLGVVLGVIAIIALAIWLWLRRRRQDNPDSPRPESSFMARTGDSSSSNNIPSRQVSQMSSAGLLGNKAPRINTFGMPAGTDPRSADTASSGFDRRSVGTDQRLNPYALYIHDEGRVSDVSLQDNQDYSRQLRVANPDT